jgi:hypothetical protein
LRIGAGIAVDIPKVTIGRRRAPYYTAFEGWKRTQMTTKVSIRSLRAQALSVLQTDYELPLREPLQQHDAVTLDAMTAKAHDLGANAYDVAAIFMAFHMHERIKWALDLNQLVCDDVPYYYPMMRKGFERTRDRMAYPTIQDNNMREVEEIKAVLDARDRMN